MVLYDISEFVKSQKKIFSIAFRFAWLINYFRCPGWVVTHKAFLARQGSRKIKVDYWIYSIFSWSPVLNCLVCDHSTRISEYRRRLVRWAIEVILKAAMFKGRNSAMFFHDKRNYFPKGEISTVLPSYMTAWKTSISTWIQRTFLNIFIKKISCSVPLDSCPASNNVFEVCLD